MKSLSRWLVTVAAAMLIAGCAPEQAEQEAEEGEATESGQTGTLIPGRPQGTETDE